MKLSPSPSYRVSLQHSIKTLIDITIDGSFYQILNTFFLIFKLLNILKYLIFSYRHMKMKNTLVVAANTTIFIN